MSRAKRTALQRMPKADKDMAWHLLLAASRLIRSGREHYICLAVGVEARLQYDISPGPIRWLVVAGTLKNEIERRLNGTSCLEGWLYQKHDILVRSHDTEAVKKVRATRLAWIDSMLKELT